MNTTDQNMTDDLNDRFAQQDRVRFALPATRASAGLWAAAALFGLMLVLALFNGLGDKSFSWVPVLALTLAMTPAIGVLYWLTRKASNARESELVIGREGIYAPKMAASLVPWDKIEAISIFPNYYRRQKQGVIMRLHVGDSRPFGPKGSALVKLANRWSHGGDLVFPIAALSGTPDEVVAAIERFAPSGLAVRNELRG